MAKDRVVFVPRDPTEDVPFHVNVNNALKSLGNDVEVVDIDIFTYSTAASFSDDCVCAKIWYRPKRGI